MQKSGKLRGVKGLQERKELRKSKEQREQKKSKELRGRKESKELLERKESKKPGRQKKLTNEKKFAIINYTLLTISMIIFLYPLIYIVSSSFSSVDAVVAGKVKLLPVDFSLEGYKAVFKSSSIWSGYWNSIKYTVLGTAINVFVTFLAAYPLSRKDLKGRNFIMMFFTFTMIFNGGIVPTYLVVSKLGLLDSIWSMVLPGAMSVYFMIIAKTFFQNTIPMELQEAAEMEGCNTLQLIWHVILPLSKAIFAVLVLFYAISIWNSYFDALIYLKTGDKYPLQLVLREILIRSDQNASMVKDAVLMAKSEGLKQLLKYSLIVVSSLPVLCIYPFVQKYFVKGLMIGSVKG